MQVSPLNLIDFKHACMQLYVVRIEKQINGKKERIKKKMKMLYY